MNIKNRKTKTAAYVTKNQLKHSKSSLAMAFELKQTGQLTENCVIFDDLLPGITLNLSVIYKHHAPYNLNVQKWYENKPYHLKIKISELMFELALNQKILADFINDVTAKRKMRFITTDPVNGENSDIIGYFFHYVYQK